MAEAFPVEIIAWVETDFPEKFGIPRQSGLADTKGRVIFAPEYRNPDALRGLEGFSHIWLIWQFSKSLREGWSPTVRPPRLGGNRRIGVFATRSPFRPNAIGLSAVKLEAVRQDPRLGPVLEISGADLVDGTPVFDIKPYLPLADSIPGAAEGFAGPARAYALAVNFPERLKGKLPPDKAAALETVLAQDPRPSYHEDPERVYGFPFAGFEIRFAVAEGVLTVCDVERQAEGRAEE